MQHGFTIKVKIYAMYRSDYIQLLVGIHLEDSKQVDNL